MDCKIFFWVGRTKSFQDNNCDQSKKSGPKCPKEGPMEKFIKSFFNTAERRRNSRIEENEEDKSLPPLDGRRKLSTSRSGRMKQANKKRHSLSLDVYNNNNQEMQMTEKPKSADITTTQRPPAVTEHKQTAEVGRSLSVEEEIDSAFEIINKSLVTDL